MNPYEALDVPTDAGLDQIKRARNHKAREHHPDTGAKPDAEKFDRAQRAYVVLTDPDKRRRYDETGDASAAEESPELAREREAMTLVAQLFSAMVSGDVHPGRTDVLGEMRNHLNQGRSQALQEIAQAKQMIERLEGFRQRLKKKSKKTSPVLTDLVDGQIGMIKNQGIPQAERKIAVIERASAILDGYEYQTDAPPRQRPMTLSEMIDAQMRTF